MKERNERNFTWKGRYRNNGCDGLWALITASARAAKRCVEYWPLACHSTCSNSTLKFERKKKKEKREKTREQWLAFGERVSCLGAVLATSWRWVVAKVVSIAALV